MKLLYVYLADYPPFHKAEFSFDSDFAFAFRIDAGVPKLTVRKYHVLPRDFFSSGYSRTSMHLSVSAVIGKNGSGKTTLADVLRRVLTNETITGDYIFVFEVSGKIVVKYRFAKTKDITEVRLLVRAPSELRNKVLLIGSGLPKRSRSTAFLDSARLSYVYISPVFTTERMIGGDGKTTFDYSTTALLNGAIAKYGSKAREMYNVEEKLRILDVIGAFAALNTKNKTLQENILSSSGVALRFRYEEFSRAVQQYVGDGCGTYEAVLKSLRALSTRMVARKNSYHFIDDFGLRFFYCLSVIVVTATIRKSLRQGMSVAADGLDVSDNLFECVVEALYKIRSVDTHQKRVTIAEEALVQMRGVDDTANLLVSIYTNLRNSQKAGVSLNKQGAYYDFTMEEATSYYLSAISENALLGEEFCVFDFDVCPKKSSGEMAFLSYWGRLYDFFKRNAMLDGHFHQTLIFLDEIEMSLHPEWQQGLVWDTIRFLETFAPKVQAHVIFGSHSPILLSDIPKGNVSFLPVREDDRYASVYERARKMSMSSLKNTFACDIFELYRRPFFLRKGTLGRFAKHKIKLMRNDIRYKGINSQDVKKQINLIGDCFLAGCITATEGCSK